MQTYQLDCRRRRVVVGFATVQLTDQWPILHLSSNVLAHDLATRDLLLSLKDSTPQHHV